VHGKRDEAYAAVRIEPLHRLHEAYVPFLDEVGMRQPVAEVTAGERDHQPQVRQHQLARRLEVVLLAEAARKTLLLFRAQQREAVDRLDISLDAARGHRHGGRYGERQRSCSHVISSKRGQV